MRWSASHAWNHELFIIFWARWFLQYDLFKTLSMGPFQIYVGFFGGVFPEDFFWPPANPALPSMSPILDCDNRSTTPVALRVERLHETRLWRATKSVLLYILHINRWEFLLVSHKSGQWSCNLNLISIMMCKFHLNLSRYFMTWDILMHDSQCRNAQELKGVRITRLEKWWWSYLTWSTVLPGLGSTEVTNSLEFESQNSFIWIPLCGDHSFEP